MLPLCDGMEIQMKKTTFHTLCVFILLLFLCALYLTSCSRYDEDWIIGKTSTEIVEKYGEFDLCFGKTELGADGNYYNGACGYMTKKIDPEIYPSDEYYMIYFDEEGKAYKVEPSWYQKGG